MDVNSRAVEAPLTKARALAEGEEKLSSSTVHTKTILYHFIATIVILFNFYVKFLYIYGKQSYYYYLIQRSSSFANDTSPLGLLLYV